MLSENARLYRVSEFVIVKRKVVEDNPVSGSNREV